MSKIREVITEHYMNISGGQITRCEGIKKDLGEQYFRLKLSEWNLSSYKGFLYFVFILWGYLNFLFLFVFDFIKLKTMTPPSPNVSPNFINY
jgi:hypothetical protein